MDKKPYMILVASQKGGVGKTTIALNLATALIYKKYRVLLVDSDMESASLSEQLGIKLDGKGYAEAVEGEAGIGDIIFAYEPIDLYIIPGSPAREVPMHKAEKLASFYADLRKLDYDFIIVDNPPGLFIREVSRYFNDIAILTTPDPVSTKVNARMAEYCDKNKLQHRLIVNRVGYSKYQLSTEDVEKLFGDIVFQMVPEDQIVAESVAKHKPAYMLDKDSQFSLAIEELAREYALKIGEPEISVEQEFESRHHTGFFEKLGRWLMKPK